MCRRWHTQTTRLGAYSIRCYYLIAITEIETLYVLSIVQYENPDPVQRVAAMHCGFAWWLQHLSPDYRAGGVVSDAKTEAIFYGAGDTGDVRALPS
jgi:hypothetical protein